MTLDLAPYAAVLLDLDGTLCHDDHPLPGAVELVRHLHATGKTVGVISNSGSGPLRAQMRLHAMNIEIDSSHIYTCASHAADTVLEMFPPRAIGVPRPRVFNLGTDSIAEMLDGKVDWVQTVGEPCDCILVAGPSVGRYSEAGMRTALQLARDGATIIGLCADRVFPSRRGLEFGAGSLTAMLAYAANRQPVFCGKPQPEFFLHLCRRLNLRPETCLLIGDNLEADIAGGRAVGMNGVLTLTGASRRGDVLSMPAERRPVAIVEDLREIF